MASDFSSIWQSFLSELASRNERLDGELAAAWRELDAILESQKQSFPAPGAWRWEYGKIDALRALFDKAAPALLAEPMQRYRKARPQERVLAALEDYEAGIAVSIRRLPAAVEVSGRDLADTLRPEARGRIRAVWRRWQRRPRTVPLRAIAEAHFQRQREQRAEWIGTYLLVLAQASLAVVDPWEALSEEALGCIEGGQANPRFLKRARERWLQLSKRLRRRAEEALGALHGSIGGSPAEFATALLRRPRSPERPSRFSRPGRLLQYGSYWSRQRVAVSQLLELDLKLAGLGRLAVQAAEATLASLRSEHQDLLSELDAVAAWLQTHKQGDGEPFPPAQARLASADDRARDWLRVIASSVREKLPTVQETIQPKRALPGWVPPWKEIRPLQLLQTPLEGPGLKTALEGLREAEAAHQSIVREIERAREVVTYSLESTGTEGDSGDEVAREGFENALSLILYQRQIAGEVAAGAETGLVEGTALAFARCYVAVDQGRLGVLAHFAHEGGYRSLRVALRMASANLRRLVVWLWARFKRAYHWTLIRIGWERAPEPRFEHVKRRGYLGDSLHLEHAPSDLPMIYERLFRLQPVEDPRFLVGRDAEMAALADARSQWENGRAVAVIIAGERGSGKTSLLNCALVRVFADAPIVQGRFRERLEDPQKVETFLRGMLALPDGEDLRLALTQQRRIIILEEAERAFLRHVNGFEGLRALLSLISGTSRETLWILSLNRVSFRFLSAAAGLDRYFSHQINAMAVEPQDLTNAILMRHNLSGLRLHFAAPASRSWPIEQARQLLGLQEDRQQEFFDTLYRQSEGVFRSAFELWRRYIDRVEGGILYMRSPVPPSYGSLASHLTREDLFTLQAILQHGSLTPQEHAVVFALSEIQSRNRIESLADRDLLEPDPQAPGWRVRPEAGYFVRRTLDAENLI